MQHDSLFTHLKSKNYRLTPVRTALVELFGDCPCAITFQDIQTTLAVRNLRPNKTTLYRELEFLKHENIITEIDFGEGKKRYERAEGHHHHLICTECHSVQDVALPNDLHEHEHRIFRDTRFKVTRHMLEFFGLCRQCQEKEPTL